MNRITLLFLGMICMSAAALALAADDKKADPGKPVVLFNGKDMAGWKLKGNNETKNKWVVGFVGLDEKSPNKFAVAKEGTGDGNLINTASGVDLFTESKQGDGTYEIDVMVPKGSNSGIYLMGEYEIQILDSFGKEKVGPGDMGGIYGSAAPKVNACKKPGEWQKFVIEYTAPKFADGKKTMPMKVIKVVLNDQVIHENVEIKGVTGGALTGKEAETGPLMFQGDHGPVAFRNIKFTPKTK